VSSDAARPRLAPYQARNLVCFAGINGLLFLCAPMTYVDVLHVTLLTRLGGSRTVANLPMSAYYLTTVSPLIIQWLIPDYRRLKAVLVGVHCLAAAAGAMVAVALLLPLDRSVRIGAMIVYGTAIGTALCTSNVYIWEALATGVSEAWRGRALGWTFSIGPVFAVAGSLATQRVVGGAADSAFPREYALMFACTVPAMLLAAGLAAGFRFASPPTPDTDQVGARLIAPPEGIPSPAEAAPSPLGAVNRAPTSPGAGAGGEADLRGEARPPFLAFLFGGFWDFLRTRQFLLLCLSYCAIATALAVLGNLSLNTKEAMGVEPKSLAGTMLALRFGGKIVAGVALGVILSRFGPRAALMAGLGAAAAAVIWAMTMPGTPYLAALALLGGAELACVYFISYCVTASPPEDIKRNVAFLSLALLPSFGAATLHGWLADHFGFTTSFGLALGAIAAAVAFARELPYHAPRRET
jgi:hypothetical protein